MTDFFSDLSPRDESAIEAVSVCRVPDHLYNYPPMPQHLPDLSPLPNLSLVLLIPSEPLIGWSGRASLPCWPHDWCRMVEGDSWVFSCLSSASRHQLSDKRLRDFVAFSLKFPYCCSQDNKTFTGCWGWHSSFNCSKFGCTWIQNFPWVVWSDLQISISEYLKTKTKMIKIIHIEKSMFNQIQNIVKNVDI